MDMIILGSVVLLGFYMAWNIGANDVANSMADAVGSKALTLKQAVIAAGICEFAGAVLVGSHVADTVRKGIVDPEVLAHLPGMVPSEAATLFVIGMASALLAAAIWLNISSLTGMPVSTTHSIVGAVAGFGIVAAGFGAVNWIKMSQIVASWFISPIVGGTMGFVIFTFISKTILGSAQPVRAAEKITPFIVFFLALTVTMATIYKGLKHIIKDVAWLTDNNTLLIAFAVAIISAVLSKFYLHRKLADKAGLSIAKQLELVEQIFVPMVIISSCSVAFAHGSNDVANAVGPLSAVVSILHTGTVAMRVGVPFWIMVLGGAGIVVGLATYGYRVMATVGSDITEITPSRGVAADIATTVTVLACSRMGLPISTTHTLVGAILGIGMARGFAGINRDVTKKIFGAWLITVPAAAVVSIILFMIGREFLFNVVHHLILAA
ncbi:MAG: inorganic phosphate transporter [Deltaproteobacteria bacterium]|nr:inorganic phosphate transporter [Deltaproteobacteria bacterium]